MKKENVTFCYNGEAEFAVKNGMFISKIILNKKTRRKEAEL